MHIINVSLRIVLQSKFIEIALRYECSPVNLLHIFGTHFLKNTSGGLLLIVYVISKFHHICHLSCIINAVDRMKYSQYFHFCYFIGSTQKERLTFMSLFFLYIFGKNVFLRFPKNQFFYSQSIILRNMRKKISKKM